MPQLIIYVFTNEMRGPYSSHIHTSILIPLIISSTHSWTVLSYITNTHDTHHFQARWQEHIAGNLRHFINIIIPHWSLYWFNIVQLLLQLIGLENSMLSNNTTSDEVSRSHIKSRVPTGDACQHKVKNKKQFLCCATEKAFSAFNTCFIFILSSFSLNCGTVHISLDIGYVPSTSQCLCLLPFMGSILKDWSQQRAQDMVYYKRGYSIISFGGLNWRAGFPFISGI